MGENVIKIMVENFIKRMGENFVKNKCEKRWLKILRMKHLWKVWAKTDGSKGIGENFVKCMGEKDR